ncbi:hypothetical protein CVT24_005173 [Panaeolus cyanescens]|uniref:Uncharacterized protein n=1 Tax=Panaeolus cyanescens TaxID=181874 RepID=A0A409Y9J6_9AGAR|nr:hypothetical protein CVT24_005173 [Panaeolus cyanescens]
MKDPPATIDVFPKPYPAIPPLQDTALSVVDQGLAGPIDPSHVYTGAEKNDPYDKLLKKVAGFIGNLYSNESLPKELTNGGKEAIERTVVARKEAQVMSFFSKPPGSAYTPKYTKETLYGIEYSQLDLDATRTANPGVDMETMQAQWNAHRDVGHEENIRVLRGVLKRIEESQKWMCS